MASVRSRITAAYSVATIISLSVLAVLFGVERYVGVEQDLAERTTRTAALAARVIERQGVQGVTLDTAYAAGNMFNLGVTRVLDELNGYYIVVADSTGRILYWSEPVRRIYYRGYDETLPPAQRALYRIEFDSIRNAALGIVNAATPRRVQLSTEQVLMTAHLPSQPLPGGVRRIVVGISTQRLRDVVSESISLAVLASPVLLGLSIGVAWMLSGRVLEPIDRMVDDVAAITDGRSLHRRVVLESETTDELGRLGQTVNDMIARLETSFSSLRRFTADASHELRTPLTVIRADVERAMSVEDQYEKAVALEEALQQVSRMTGLVESLLTLARSDEGRFDIIREPVPLEPLFREVVETATILGEDAEITVTLPVIQPVTVSADAERLRQLFLNLATNAIKYTPRGGMIELSLETRHDEAIVTVRDNGIGIAAADLPFIFDRFWRVDTARSRSEGSGVGLGLAICQWIAQAHNGRIDVTSRLGRGSTFTVVLPAHRSKGENS